MDLEMDALAREKVLVLFGPIMERRILDTDKIHRPPSLLKPIGRDRARRKVNASRSPQWRRGCKTSLMLLRPRRPGLRQADLDARRRRLRGARCLPRCWK